jgi:zinc transport system ATP-binding protein
MPRKDRNPANAEVTLRAYDQDRQIFSSVGKCLHLLFELERFLDAASYRRETVRVEDKIVGKAAALLLVKLGIRKIKAGVLSKLGREVLDRFAADYEAVQVVERIDCQTESILAEVEDPEQAYRIVRARAGC